MKLAIRAIGTALMLVAFYGCDGLGSGLSGPSNTERGEANAINPGRNITVICEEIKNQNTSATVSVTNNCSKNNPVTTTAPAAE